MRFASITFILLVIATAGCDQSQFTTALSALEADNAKLTQQLEDANNKTAEVVLRISAIESAWKQFELSFESDKRQELTKNITAVEQMIAQAAKNAESSAGVLKRFQELEAEVLNLRDMCKMHASDSADANQLGQLNASISRVESTVNTLKTSIGPTIGSNISHRIQMLETDVRFMKMKVR